MKKLLLASIIMFGICSFAGAQSLLNVKERKEAARKNGNSSAGVVSTTPQKAVTTPAATTGLDGTVVENKAATTTEKAEANDKAKKLERFKATEKAADKKDY